MTNELTQFESEAQILSSLDEFMNGLVILRKHLVRGEVHAAMIACVEGQAAWDSITDALHKSSGK